MSAAEKLLGTVVSERYRLERVLGEGGMGTVYEAEHLLIGRRVAVKTLLPELASDPSILERFRREAKAASTIGHEHIVDVMDMGTLDDGAPFLVMELLDGQELAELLEDNGPLPIGRAVRILLPVCSALGAAHEAGILHRDLKPANIFLVARSDGSDFPKVLDFGISKTQRTEGEEELTKTGVAIGTPAYMSPEQAQGLKSVDHRTDVYAIGAILFELLTGGLPFRSDSFARLLLKVLVEPPPSLRDFREDIPEALDELVQRALAKQPADRHEHMQALMNALEPFAALDEPAAAVQPVTERDLSLDTFAPANTTVLPPSEPPPADDASTTSFDPAEVPRVPIRSPSRLAVGAGLALLGLAALGAGFVLVPDDRPDAQASSSSEASPPARREIPRGSEPPAEPSEVRVRVRVIPSDAAIYLAGTRFPNPMDAMQPRSLTPTPMRIEREGYRTLERLVILDEDRSFDLEMQAAAPTPRAEPRARPRPEAPRMEPATIAPSSVPSTPAGGLRSEF